MAVILLNQYVLYERNNGKTKSNFNQFFASIMLNSSLSLLADCHQ